MIAQREAKIERPYIDLEEACSYLSISKATMYQKTMRKTIPHFKCGRKILFKVNDLNNYIESNRIKTTSEIESEALQLILKEKIQ